jgi:hypothetical protein
VTPEFNPVTVRLAELQRRLNEAPFAPFAIVMSSGKSYPVPTTDHLTITRLSRRVFVEFDDYSSATINLLHVTAIEPLAPSPRQ